MGRYLDAISAFGTEPEPAQNDVSSKSPYERNEKNELRADGWNGNFEERAAILEYDTGLSREEAERRARAEVDGVFSPPPTVH